MKIYVRFIDFCAWWFVHQYVIIKVSMLDTLLTRSELVNLMTDLSLPVHSPHHQPDDEALDVELVEKFRASGHRLTPQRLTLLKLMQVQGGFLDADELHRLADLRGADLSLATIYRTLALFKELKLVEGRIVGPEQEREEYRLRTSQTRYTLTCKRCGAIVPVESDIVDSFREVVTAQLGITVVTAHSCFIGYCAACTAELAAEDEAAAGGSSDA